MTAWLTLDFVAKRYGQLPTKVLSEGSTVDTYCANLAMQYEVWQMKKANKQNGAEDLNNMYSTEQLREMLDKVKRKTNEG